MLTMIQLIPFNPCLCTWDEGERLRQCGVTPSNNEVEMSLMPTVLSLCDGFGEHYGLVW